MPILLKTIIIDEGVPHDKPLFKMFDHATYNRPFLSSLVFLFHSKSKGKNILVKMTDLHENETACKTHFHVKGFALRLVLKQRFERTRKWPIQPGLSIEPDFPLHGLTCTENPGMDISSKYKLHTTPTHLGKRNL